MIELIGVVFRCSYDSQQSDMEKRMKGLENSSIYQVYAAVQRYMREKETFPWHMYDLEGLFYPSLEFVYEEAFLKSDTNQVGEKRKSCKREKSSIVTIILSGSTPWLVFLPN